MKNDEYFELNNGIYPCPLCIAVGRDWQNSDFEDICNKPLEKDVTGRTYCTSTEELGNCLLIRFASKAKMQTDVIAHEALHATFHILDYAGCVYDGDNSEHACYLLGWIVRCCEKVKLGKTEK